MEEEIQLSELYSFFWCCP